MSAYTIAAVPFSQVRLADEFWTARLETNRTVTIPFGFRKSEEEGRLSNFEHAARHDGVYEGKMPFDDTDVYKLIEGRVLLAPEPPGSRARSVPRRHHREDRGGPGGRRLSDDLQDDRSVEEPRPVAEARAEVGPRARGQPRAVQRRSPLRSRVRALPRDRQAHAARRRPPERGPRRTHVRSRQAHDAAGPPDRRDRPDEALRGDR